jgi:NTP pyrophosphatase (non-canonical NTP hydrolase)
MIETFKEITQWQRKTFPNQTALSATSHLVEEVDELLIDLIEGAKTNARQEIADCFILLCGIADKMDMDYHELMFEVKTKMKINKARQWQAPDENGVIRHKK